VSRAHTTLACLLAYTVLLTAAAVSALGTRGSRRRALGWQGHSPRVALTAGDGRARRYVYEWDLGPTSARVTPESAMTLMQASPDRVFPFDVGAGSRIEPGRPLSLGNVRWPRDNGHPVRVVEADAVSFTFLTLPGHFRGPGHTIRFATLARDGRLILRHAGESSDRLPDVAYDSGAWVSWRTQASRLRSLVFGEVAP
jgi:hypothetical protein